LNCDQAETFLDEFLDKKNPPENPEAIGHIENCPTCLLKTSQWEKIRKSLATSPSPEVPNGLSEKILLQWETGLSTEKLNQKKPRVLISFNRLVTPAAVAAILVFGVGLWLFTPLENQQFLETTDSKPAVTPPSEISQPALKISAIMPGAKSVALVGDFNKWNRQDLKLKKTGKGNWEIELPLDSGYYQYQLLADGKNWLLDPTNKIKAPDGFGGFNSAVLL